MDHNMFLTPDYADPEPNTNALDDLFNVAIENNQIIDTGTGEILGEVNAMRKELQELQDDLPDADQILVDNIARANRILDKVEDSIDRGVFTASMIEAAGRMIETVTSAANSITGIGYNAEVIRQKDRDLDRKERELLVKGLVKGAENVTINNNNLTMNREELLKLISDSKNKAE
jgi:hypothetical protein